MAVRLIGMVLTIALCLSSALAAEREAATPHAGEHVPYARGRMYSIPSAEALEAVTALVKELKLGLAATDAGVVVTRERTFSNTTDSPPKHVSFSGFEPREYQLFLFVPQVIEPARVYADTLVTGRFQDGRLGSLYGTPEVNNWFFEKLESRLGTSGNPIPLGVTPRRELADRLLGGATEKNEGEPYKALDGMLNPKRIRASYVQPVYPGDDRARRRRGKVYMRALLTEGGYIVHLRVLESTNPDARFHDAAVAAARYWRYQPARSNGKPVAAYLTIIVEFTT